MTEPTIPARRRWASIVRITHWSSALVVLANYVFTEEGPDPHVCVGDGLAAILTLRLMT